MGALDAWKRDFATTWRVNRRAAGVPHATLRQASIKCTRSSVTVQPIDLAGPVRDLHRRRLTRVALATTIGTAIEAFDFLAVGTAAALVFNRLFFPGFDSTMFCPQASLYSAQFPPELRYSGLSLGIQLAAALGGGLTPIIATALLKVSGGLVSVGAYLAMLGLLATLCAWLMQPHSPPEHEFKRTVQRQERL
jgi:MFS transporter, MHS family, shikimate and dehydroshikimate transport protein